MTVLSWAKHTLILNQKSFRQIDNEQYNYHTDPCTVYIRILYNQILNVLRLLSRLSNSSTKSSKPNFQIVRFQRKWINVTNFHWSWNFWEMFSLTSFLKNFSRTKRWWREELQLPVAVTIKRSFLNEDDLRILSSVFQLEIFNLTSGERAEIRKRTTSESLQKTRTKFYEVAGHARVDLKLQSRTTSVRCFEVVYTRQQNAILQPG